MGELTELRKVPQFSQFSGILQHVLQFSVTFSVFLAGGSLNDHFFYIYIYTETLPINPLCATCPAQNRRLS